MLAHVEITGLVARDMVKALTALRASSAEELQREVSSIYERYDQWLDKLDDQYDAETEHGTNPKAQQGWIERIRSSIQTGSSLGAPP